MISRVWRGWTTIESAEIYESLLRTEIIPGIRAKGGAGLRRFELFRQSQRDEVEFVTVFWFDDLDSIKAVVGDDYETAYIPAKAREVLSRFDNVAQHYDVRDVCTN